MLNSSWATLDLLVTPLGGPGSRWRPNIETVPEVHSLSLVTILTAKGIRPFALAAFAWSLAFAAIHVAWALGSTAGLGGRRVTGLLLAIDIVAIPLCLLAAGVAWRLRDKHRARQAPPVIYRMAWAAAVVLGLRGLGTIQALIAPTDDATTLTRLVDPFFLLGGALFGLLAWRAAGDRGG